MIWYSILDIDNNVFYNWSDPGNKKRSEKSTEDQNRIKKRSFLYNRKKDQEK